MPERLETKRRVALGVRNTYAHWLRNEAPFWFDEGEVLDEANIIFRNTLSWTPWSAYSDRNPWGACSDLSGWANHLWASCFALEYNSLPAPIGMRSHSSLGAFPLVLSMFENPNLTAMGTLASPIFHATETVLPHWVDILYSGKMPAISSRTRDILLNVGSNMVYMHRLWIRCRREGITCNRDIVTAFLGWE